MGPFRSRTLSCLADPLRIRRWLNDCLEWVYPRTCLRCGGYLRPEQAGFTCDPCFAGYAFIGEHYCVRCGSPHLGHVLPDHWCANCREHPPAFESAQSLFRYVGTGARLVHSLKYEGGVWGALEVERLLRRQPRVLGFFTDAVLVPVPLHPRKLRRRGYNQAVVVAEGIQRVLPETRLWGGLRRVRDTPTQTALSRRQRQRNVLEAFAPVGDIPPAGRLVLIDDVLTTGSTLNAAATALRRLGASKISAFTLAHG